MSRGCVDASGGEGDPGALENVGRVEQIFAN